MKNNYINPLDLEKDIWLSYLFSYQAPNSSNKEIVKDNLYAYDNDNKKSKFIVEEKDYFRELKETDLDYIKQSIKTMEKSDLERIFNIINIENSNIKKIVQKASINDYKLLENIITKSIKRNT